MSWSTRLDHRRYFSQFGRADDVPARRAAAVTKELDAYGDGTVEIMRYYEELWALDRAEVVVPLLERWQQLDRVGSPSEKQDFLEPLITKVQRQPAVAQGELIMVLLALESLRRSIASRYLHSQRVGSPAATTRKERADAKLLREIEWDDVVAITQAETLRVLHSYHVGAVAPGRIFGWFKEALSHRLLEALNVAFRAGDASYTREEAEAVQAFLHGLDQIDAPPLSHRASYQRWRFEISATASYVEVDRYFDHPRVRQICRVALDRLSPKQRDVLERYYYDRISLDQIACDWGRASSTARNTKIQAEAKLRSDDIFFTALAAVGIVRGSARFEAIRSRYPDGRPTGEGRRRVVIDAA
jgi:Sigma-70, region 4